MGQRNREKATGLLGGIILIIIGLAFLGERYNWWGLNLDMGIDKIWPVFIIAAGIYMIFKHKDT